MQFELTDEIRNLIVFAMEDQGNSYLFDSVDQKTVIAGGLQLPGFQLETNCRRTAAGRDQGNDQNQRDSAGREAGDPQGHFFEAGHTVVGQLHNEGNGFTFK